MPAADIAALLARFSELKQKSLARTGKSLLIVVIQEAGLDGLWIHRVLQSKGIESHVVDPALIAMSRWRDKTDRIDGDARLRALLVSSASNLGCARWSSRVEKRKPFVDQRVDLAVGARPAQHGDDCEQDHSDLTTHLALRATAVRDRGEAGGEIKCRRHGGTSESGCSP